MDANDIIGRIKRTRSAMNSRIDEDFISHSKIEKLENGVSVTIPARDSKETIEVSIMSILYSLASLKDNLKNCLKDNGHNPLIVEEAVNSSIHLQVLHDLVNADKHGYPTKKNHSGLNPVIRNENQGLINNNFGKPVVASISPTGEIKILDGIPPSVVITADIHDKNGNFLFDFDILVEVCYAIWISIAKEYKCI